MTDDAWYRRYFGPDYLRIYRLADTPAQLAFLTARLAPLAPARVLDLPCGHGRHAVPLSRLGLRFVGLDLSLPFLHVAQRSAADEGVPLPLVRGDMRWFPFTAASFDAAICMFNSLGYFERDEDNQLVLNEFGRVVRPGGPLLLDLANIDHVRIQPTFSAWEKDGTRVETEYVWHEAARQAETVRQVTFDDGRHETYRSWWQFEATRSNDVDRRRLRIEARKAPRRRHGPPDARADSMCRRTPHEPAKPDTSPSGQAPLAVPCHCLEQAPPRRKRFLTIF